MISIIGAICNGLSMPIYSIIFGNLTDSFAYEDSDTKLNKAGLNTMYIYFVLKKKLHVCVGNLYIVGDSNYVYHIFNSIRKLNKKIEKTILKSTFD